MNVLLRAGVDFKVKTIVLDQKRVKLSIWVSGGGVFSVEWVWLTSFPTGHCWAGKISNSDPKLLPWSPGSDLRLAQFSVKLYNDTATQVMAYVCACIYRGEARMG